MVVEAWTETAGEVVESRMLEALRNETLQSGLFDLNRSPKKSLIYDCFTSDFLNR